MINVPMVWSLFAHSKYHHKLIAFGNVFVFGSLVVVFIRQIEYIAKCTRRNLNQRPMKSTLKSAKLKVCQKPNMFTILTWYKVTAYYILSS